MEYGPDESNVGPNKNVRPDSGGIDSDVLDGERFDNDGLDSDGPDAMRSVPAGVLVWIVAVLAVLVAVGWTLKIRTANSGDTAGITAVPEAITPADRG